MGKPARFSTDRTARSAPNTERASAAGAGRRIWLLPDAVADVDAVNERVHLDRTEVRRT
jgi:hypothetical protein